MRLHDSGASTERVLSDVSAGDANVTDGAWHHVTLTRVRNGTNTLYVNGVSQDTSTGPDTAIDPTGDIYIGRREDGSANRYFGGTLDEIRISDVERSVDWVKTVYNNTNGPGDIGAADFYTVGTEETTQPLTAVELVAFTATGYDRGVLLAWATGYEIDNLGFHVYREQAGARVPLTASLIAGSGLLTQRGTAVTATRAYAWWDMAVRQTTPGLSYWLEDVDFDGTSSWHGPVTPVDGGHLIDVGPPAPGEGVAGPNSASLDGLATVRGPTRRAFLTDDAPPRTRRAANNGSGTPLEAQWAIAQQPAVKISVRRTGWFRVSQAALVGAGLDPNVDPRRLQLFVNGVEQAMTVTGEADGQFDPTDSIGFYGEGVDTASTDLRVYWVVSGASQGLRIGSATPPGPLAVTNAAGVTNAAATTAPAATDDPAPVFPLPPPTAAAPAGKIVEASTRAAATRAPTPVATPGPGAAAAPARAATAELEPRRADALEAEAAPAPARAAVPARTPVSSAPSGQDAPRATPRAPGFVVLPPAGKLPPARPRRPESSRGAERPDPPDADAPNPAVGDDETPPFMFALAARAVAWQLELARTAGVPEAAIEELLADYDPDGPIGASLRIAKRLQAARQDALDADAPQTAPVEAAGGTAPPPDAGQSPEEETL